MVKLNNKIIEFNMHGNPIIKDEDIKIKVPLSVYNRTAYRRYLRAKLREEKRKEEMNVNS